MRELDNMTDAMDFPQKNEVLNEYVKLSFKRCVFLIQILQVADLGFAMVCSFDRQDMSSENSKETGSLP